MWLEQAHGERKYYDFVLIDPALREIRFWFSNENVPSSKQISKQNFSVPRKAGNGDYFPKEPYSSNNSPTLETSEFVSLWSYSLLYRSVFSCELFCDTKREECQCLDREIMSKQYLDQRKGDRWNMKSPYHTLLWILKDMSEYNIVFISQPRIIFFKNMQTVYVHVCVLNVNLQVLQHRIAQENSFKISFTSETSYIPTPISSLYFLHILKFFSFIILHMNQCSNVFTLALSKHDWHADVNSYGKRYTWPYSKPNLEK